MKRNIVWNLTKLCVWNCTFCCVDAECVPFNNLDYEIFLSKKEKNNELSLSDKKKIIDMLNPDEYSIDFSGGELLMNRENLELIQYASHKLGKENIGISVSGAFIDRAMAETLSELVSEVEISLDYVPFYPYKYRPIGYHEYAAKAISELKRFNVAIGVQTVLVKDNMDVESIRRLFNWIEYNKVDSWSLLRFFKSGRGERVELVPPSHNEYVKSVEFIKELVQESNVDVHFQYLLPNHKGYTLECRSVKKSIGILPDGMVIGCFWALGKDMKVKDKRFVLGKLPDNSIDDILKSESSDYWLHKCEVCQFFSEETLEV